MSAKYKTATVPCATVGKVEFVPTRVVRAYCPVVMQPIKEPLVSLRFVQFILCTFAAISIASMAVPTLAAPIVSGEIEIVSPPPDASMGQYESNDFARLWEELQDVTITSPLSVDVVPFLNNASGFYDSGVASIEAQWNGTLPAGTYSSYHLHADKDGPNQVYTGTITFERPIAGIVYKQPRLNDTDTLFGIPTTIYANGPARGIELDGAVNYFSISITPDRRVLEVQTTVAHNLDNMRILLEVPEPSSLVLLCLGVIAVFAHGMHFRSRAKRSPFESH